jgi:hypothetical protein
MLCKGKYKLRSHNTCYCLIEVVAKADLTVFCKNVYNTQPLMVITRSGFLLFLKCILCYLFKERILHVRQWVKTKYVMTSKICIIASATSFKQVIKMENWQY